MGPIVSKEAGRLNPEGVDGIRGPKLDLFHTPAYWPDHPAQTCSAP